MVRFTANQQPLWPADPHMAHKNSSHHPPKTGHPQKKKKRQNMAKNGFQTIAVFKGVEKVYSEKTLHKANGKKPPKAYRTQESNVCHTHTNANIGPLKRTKRKKFNMCVGVSAFLCCECVRVYTFFLSTFFFFLFTLFSLICGPIMARVMASRLVDTPRWLDADVETGMNGGYSWSPTLGQPFIIPLWTDVNRGWIFEKKL